MKPFYSIVGMAGGIITGPGSEHIGLSWTDCAGFENDRAEWTMNDDPPLLVPTKGQKVDISLGYEMQPGAESYYNGRVQRAGTFVIDEGKCSGPPRTLSITAHANDTANNFKQTQDRDWHQQTVEQIVQKIAGETGLQARVDPDIAKKMIEHIDQANQSNMQFLSTLGSRLGALCKVAEGNLYFGRKGKIKTLSGAALTPVVVSEKQCSRWDGLLQSRSQFDGVKARHTNLGTAIEEYELEGKEGVTKTLPHRYPTKEEAADAAKGHSEDLAKETETFSFTCVGDPGLVAEVPVILVGFRPGVRTNWIVDRAVHTINNSGYTTQVECRLPDAAAKDAKVDGRE